jgi:hypothetical protein
MKHAHKWELASVKYNALTRTIEVDWYRKPSKIAITDTDRAINQHQKWMRNKNEVTYSMAGWPEEVDEKFSHLLNGKLESSVV